MLILEHRIVVDPAIGMGIDAESFEMHSIPVDTRAYSGA